MIRSMARRQVLVVAIATLVAGACSSSAPSSMAPASASTTTATAPSVAPSAGAISPAITPAGLVVGGDRPVTVHVPASYDASRPAPLLLVLHGFTGSGDEMVDYFKLAAAAEKAGFVYATPDGTKDSNGDRFWNATDACCNFHGSSVDDVAYLSSVIAEIQGELAIDPKRIAVIGHSNGGFMSYRMACERSDLVAAIVSLAGATYADPADCKPREPVSVAQVHGTVDEVIHFSGGVPLTDGTGPYPGAEATAATWAKYDGCGAEPSTLGAKVDVDADLADGADPAETSVQEWSGCEAGATVQLWTIPNGGHVPALDAGLRGRGRPLPGRASQAVGSAQSSKRRQVAYDHGDHRCENGRGSLVARRSRARCCRSWGWRCSWSSPSWTWHGSTTRAISGSCSSPRRSTSCSRT